MKIQKHHTTVLPLTALFVVGLSPALHQFTGNQGTDRAGAADISIAQAPSPGAPVVKSAADTFPYPTNVATGSVVKIDGTSSMEGINNALKQRFQAKFPGTTVNISDQGTDKALQELVAGQIDLASLGRPLTEQEKAQGLVAVPVARNKIALIVSPDSPYNGSLTIDGFAKIFRGEVTNWSQSIGSDGSTRGPDAPVRIVDRPDSSDTRQAFLNYPVFRTAPFQTGPTAVKLTEDSTDAVIAKLGKDGVGYSIADQVMGNPKVRIVKMHNTLPDDPRYPFSQSLYYVYKGPANDNVKAFLGYAANAENQQAIEEARKQAVLTPAAPAPEAAPAPAPTEAASKFQPLAAPGENKLGWGPLWWLLLPLLGLPFLIKWAKGLGAVDDGVAAADTATTGTQSSRVILTPRNCRDAYAYWELSDADKSAVRQFGKNMKLRLYDVTGINLDVQEAHSMREFDPKDNDVDMHLPITTDDRDYLVDLGYTTRDGKWVRIARSEHVHVPKCPPATTLPTGTATTLPTGTAATGAAALATGAAATVAAATSVPRVTTTPAHTTVQTGDYSSRIVLTPRNSADAYAYWEVSDEHKAAVRRQGGQKLKLRLYDVTGINLDTQSPHSVYEFDADELEHDRHLPVRTSDRDYLVEIGYVTEDGRWLKLARSEHVHVPAGQF
ncbi:MAG TPA: DUF4912 domain-containing protein [Coleofasciculaceae cyanobacterium]